LGAIAIQHTPETPLSAAQSQAPVVMGEGKGIHPGRVVWVHDPNATNWKGPGDGHWWQPEHTSRAVCDQMVSKALRAMTGESTDAAAWNAVFRYHNKTRGKGDVGYKSGEKVLIKVNFVGMIHAMKIVNPDTYSLDDWQDYMNTSPQMIGAVIKQLTSIAGVKQADISIGDSTAYFANEYYNPLHKEFPDVQYLDCKGGSGRVKVEPSTVPLYWSSRPQGVQQDYIPKPYVEAEYLINLANLKAHPQAGFTLCAKNHFGSLVRIPTDRGYYNLHTSIQTKGMGQYRDQVDLMGHAQLGGKTVLYLIDGLYGGMHYTERSPHKFPQAPFNDSWSSSLLASQDPVAIDSVGLDLLQANLPQFTSRGGGDDYLHEAALANNPPSETFYDPDHQTGTRRLSSLGVHEHWNNADDKKYSRNLGKSEGIELIALSGKAGSVASAR
jgi:uncharacterized protein (DUF362 family)